MVRVLFKTGVTRGVAISTSKSDFMACCAYLRVTAEGGAHQPVAHLDSAFPSKHVREGAAPRLHYAYLIANYSASRK